MRVDKILELPQDFLQKKIKIEGLLMATRKYIYIAIDEKNSRNTHDSILIENQKGFMDKLDSSIIPPWGGSDLTYRELIEIEGKLCRSEHESFPFILKEISTAIVEMDGKKHRLI